MTTFRRASRESREQCGAKKHVAESELDGLGANVITATGDTL